MAGESHVALLKSASGSPVRRQILADLLQSTAKQRIPPERLFEATTGVFFNCCIAQLAKLESK